VPCRSASMRPPGLTSGRANRLNRPVECPPREDARATPSTLARAGGSLGIVVISQSTPLVVGVDGSERPRDTLALAARLADPGQQLLLTHFHGYGRLSNLLSGGGYEQLVREVAASSGAAVQETLAPITQRDLRLVSSDSAAAGLQATAGRGRRFDDRRRLLPPLGHRPRARRRVTESVLAGSPVPVAVVPRDYAADGRGLRTIGCGFDGSPESRQALEWAGDLARRRRVKLRALAVHTPVAFGGVPTRGAIGHRSANDALRAALDEQLSETIAPLGDAAASWSRGTPRSS
jgi:hypothetical protein